MNKSELINEVYELLNQGAGGSNSGEAKLTKIFAEKTLNSVLEALTNGLKKDGNVQIVGFGTFSVGTRGARTGVNPRTGAKIQIKASKNIKFKAGAKLKEIL
ncbi:MAG: HU family DNA-binding protein [Verrucomicrobiota bacterium]|nr:MAG: HU family DNA-binding protein [Verrucomicrobiota bacterium]